MAKKKKFYVVWEGHMPGVYDNWAECQLQIKGCPSAKFKSFSSLAEANAAMDAGAEMHIGNKQKSSSRAGSLLHWKDNPEIDQHALSVDAACSGNPGTMEYRGLWIEHGDVLFHQGPFQQSTNNIGEFLGLVHALAYFNMTGEHDVTIYTDSRTAMAWVRNKKVKTTLKRTTSNAKSFELIDRAIKWLQTHSYSNPIVKWDTKNWGEIPADFGRK